jgi:hypothetical protein
MSGPMGCPRKLFLQHHNSSEMRKQFIYIHKQTIKLRKYIHQQTTKVRKYIHQQTKKVGKNKFRYVTFAARITYLLLAHSK